MHRFPSAIPFLAIIACAGFPGTSVEAQGNSRLTGTGGEDGVFLGSFSHCGDLITARTSGAAAVSVTINDSNQLTAQVDYAWTGRINSRTPETFANSATGILTGGRGIYSGTLVGGSYQVPITIRWNAQERRFSVASLDLGYGIRHYRSGCGETKEWFRYNADPFWLSGSLAAISINTSGPIIADACSPFALQIEAQSFEPITRYNATGLPGGLTVNRTTGLISGTPNSPGIFNIRLSAENSGSVATRDILFEVRLPWPKITLQPSSIEVRRGFPFTLRTAASPTCITGTLGNRFYWVSDAKRHSLTYPSVYFTAVKDSSRNTIWGNSLTLSAEWDLAGQYIGQVFRVSTDSGPNPHAETNVVAVGVFDVSSLHLNVEQRIPKVTDSADFVFLRDAISANVPFRAKEFAFVAQDKFEPGDRHVPDFLYAIPKKLEPISKETVSDNFGKAFHKASATASNPLWIPRGYSGAGDLWISDLHFSHLMTAGFPATSGASVGLVYRFSYKFDADDAGELEPLSNGRDALLAIDFNSNETIWTTAWSNPKPVEWPGSVFRGESFGSATARVLNQSIAWIAKPGDTTRWEGPGSGPSDRAERDKASLAFSLTDNPKFRVQSTYRDLGTASLQLPVQTLKRQGWPYHESPSFSRPDEVYLPELEREMIGSLTLFWNAVIEDPPGAWLSLPPTLERFDLKLGIVKTSVPFVGLSCVWSGGMPSVYRASEDPRFSGVEWEPFSQDVGFMLSKNPGRKTVYMQLGNSSGVSAIRSDSILLLPWSGSTAAFRPDVAVGASPQRLIGVGLHSPRLQQFQIASIGARAVSPLISVSNRGALRDQLIVRASGGNHLFRTSHFVGGTNVTANLIRGTLRTSAANGGDAPLLIRSLVSPNFRALTRRIGNRRVTLKRSHTLFARATSASDSTVHDSATIRIQTR